MKKLVLTAIAVVGIAASTFAQGTLTIDNLNGTGGNHATSLGLFFNADGTVFTGAALNVEVFSGPNSGSLTPLVTLAAGNALFGLGNGQYFDLAGGTYAANSVALGGTATIQLLAWTGSASSYAAALPTERFFAWNGSAFVDPSGLLTYTTATGGGGDPPGPPKSVMDGMPAMALVIPEPTTFALLGLGALGMMIFRRK
jgi:hypothetical protein